MELISGIKVEGESVKMKRRNKFRSAGGITREPWLWFFLQTKMASQGEEIYWCDGVKSGIESAKRKKRGQGVLIVILHNAYVLRCCFNCEYNICDQYEGKLPSTVPAYLLNSEEVLIMIYLGFFLILERCTGPRLKTSVGENKMAEIIATRWNLE